MPELYLHQILIEYSNYLKLFGLKTSKKNKCKNINLRI